MGEERSMSGHLVVERDGRILAVTLNRPDQGNRMSDDMVLELTGLLDGASETSDLVLLRATGKEFCIGWGANLPPAGSVEAYTRLRTYDMVFNCYGAFRRAKVPVIGVVQGGARGFGCAVAALCDVTLASDAATFQVPEMAHNILPTMVMSSLIDRVALKGINYLVYSAAEISASEALAFGIVSKVVPAAALEQAVKELCAAICKAPRPAILGVKEYTRSALAMEAQGAVDFARNLHAVVNTSSEMRRP
jgi:enoyl-CoA hydratase/carnithine racemase